MRALTRFFFASAIAVALAGSASAQQQGGGGQGGGGQGGGGQGGIGDLGTGLQFQAGQGLGVQSQQMQTVTNSVTNASSNVLGGYYANPYFQGRIGTYGAQSPGGFGQTLYSATGAASGASTRSGGGFNTGSGSTGGRAGGSSGMSSMGSFGGAGGGATQGFSGGSSGFGSTGGGARGGQTGGFGGGGQTGGFGGGQAGGFGGGQAGGFGGAQSMIGGRQGGLGRQMGGGMGGAANPNAVAADRPVNVFFQPTGIGTIGSPQTSTLSSRAQSELRTQYDASRVIAAGKSIDVQVNNDGIARLRGTVANDDEKRMAIGLARLTPGVRMVVSELTVTPAP